MIDKKKKLRLILKSNRVYGINNAHALFNRNSRVWSEGEVRKKNVVEIYHGWTNIQTNVRQFAACMGITRVSHTQRYTSWFSSEQNAANSCIPKPSIVRNILILAGSQFLVVVGLQDSRHELTWNWTSDEVRRPPLISIQWPFNILRAFCSRMVIVKFRDKNLQTF